MQFSCSLEIITDLGQDRSPSQPQSLITARGGKTLSSIELTVKGTKKISIKNVRILHFRLFLWIIGGNVPNLGALSRVINAGQTCRGS